MTNNNCIVYSTDNLIMLFLGLFIGYILKNYIDNNNVVVIKI